MVATGSDTGDTKDRVPCPPGHSSGIITMYDHQSGQESILFNTSSSSIFTHTIKSEHYDRHWT